MSSNATIASVDENSGVVTGNKVGDDVITVVNATGFTVYNGTNHEVDLNAPGVYVIRVKGKTLKVSVK